MSYKLEVKHHFDAAHFLPNHPGKCSRRHGHRWDVKVVYEFPTLHEIPEGGMLIDFGVVKEAVDKYDHTELNIFHPNPTAEVMAWLIWHGLPKMFPFYCVLSVSVCESPNCCVTYTSDVTGPYEMAGGVDVEGIYEQMYELKEADDGDASE